MAKKKSFKKTSSDKTEANPFNIKINRKKHSVLGEKVKGTKGLPGVSHAISRGKRKDLWFKQRIQNQKANCFVDKRLMDSSMPADERATFRLVKERQKKLKKSIFNLNDGEDLTHKGQPLHAMESFNNDGSDSEDGEQLGANFVKEAHFGGFGSDSKYEPPKSRKDIIDELIMESKKKKQERKMEKEVNADLTEKLDQEWKQLLTVMNGVQSEKQQVVHEKNDAYDVIMQELKFELRGAPTSRLKTPEEIAREEQEKLQKLEKEREIRMIDDMDYKSIRENGQLSADSIYDGLDLEPIPAGVGDSYLPDEEKTEDIDSDGSYFSSAEKEGEATELESSDNKDMSVHEEDNSQIPVSMEDFVDLVNCTSLKELPGLLENLINANVPCKSEKRLCKLETLFGIIVEYILDCCKRPCENIEISAELFPHLYTLAEASPLKTAYKILFFLDKEQQVFEKSKGKKKKKNFPRLQTFLLLKLCSVLYSVSDFRHPVVTPAMLFMSDILSSAYCTSFENIVSRLFVSRIILNCILSSKRLIPEALNFLNKVLIIAVDNKTKAKSKKREKFNLVPSATVSVNQIAELSLLQPDNTACADSKKLSILSELVNQLSKLASLYGNVLSYAELFSKTLNICSALPCDKYPKCLQETVNQLTQIIKQNSIRTLKSLSFINPKPKPLKLFEPAFDSKYTMKKDDISKKRKLIKQVSQKIRKEERGLLREMRRDMQVVSAVKLNERLEADEERKRKVKKLYQDLAVQEGECKKFEKKF